MANDDLLLAREGNLIRLAIPSKYGPPRLACFEPDEAREFARCLLELADEIDTSSQTRKIAPASRRRGKILKLMENPKTKP